MEAIILAGGKGTRLKSLVSDRPKPLADINGQPFLSILLSFLVRQGCQHFILATGHQREMIRSKYAGDYLGIPISYSEETNPLGTGGAVINAHKKLKNNKKYVNVAKSLPANWTNGRLPKQKNTFIFKGDEISVLYKNISDNVIDVFGSVVEIIDVSTNVVEILFNSKRLSAKVTQDGELLLIHQSFGDILLSLKPRFMLPGKSTQTGGLTAPMPGKIIGISTKVGTKVKKGDTLLILEAMKMEHSIKATSDGLVKELFFKKNDQVENGATLLILEPKK